MPPIGFVFFLVGLVGLLIGFIAGFVVACIGWDRR